MINVTDKSKILTLISILTLVCFVLLMSKTTDRKLNSLDTIKIGGAFGLTGQCAEFGEGELRATQMVVDEVNTSGGVRGKTIELIIEDTKCDYKSTYSAVNKLISVNKVVGIIGPTWGDSFQSAVPLVNNLRIPTITPSGAIEAVLLQKQAIEYYFSTWPKISSEVQIIQDYMIQQKNINVVVVHDQDPFGVLMSTAFEESARSKGINLVKKYNSVTGTEDYRVVLSKIIRDRPDAIFMAFVGPESSISFIKQAKEFGLDLPMYSPSYIQNETLLNSFGKYMEGVVYSFPKEADNYAKFVSAYVSKYGAVPQGPSAIYAYDAMRIMIEAIKDAGPNTTSTQIKDALLKSKIDGFSTDIVTFNKEHQVFSSQAIVKTVKDGKFIQIIK